MSQQFALDPFMQDPSQDPSQGRAQGRAQQPPAQDLPRPAQGSSAHPAQDLPRPPADDLPRRPSPGVAATISALPTRLLAPQARGRTSRETVAERAYVEDVPGMPEALQEIWDEAAAEGPQLARKLRRVAVLWRGEDEDPDVSTHRDVEAVAAAAALRLTLPQAERVVRDAHRATTDLAGCFDLLEDGTFPAHWFQQVLARTRRLHTEHSRQVLDLVISGWDLRISAETFTTRLNALITWLEVLEREEVEDEQPVTRRVDLTEGFQGEAMMTATGPMPELMATMRRLDQAARAVRAAQAEALRNGGPIPWDIDGEVSRTGKPLRLDALRYLLMTRAEFDTDGVDVPAERFRITMTVPVFTLLGVSDAPGMLDGTHPIPADLARLLTAGESTWYRVLTDPCSGEFLPLPATRYTPTRAMQEHLRLRGGVCAVPGCTRTATIAAECDHIEEFLAGGRTEIENLHWLCLFHHQEKTAGLLDPVRIPDPAAGPGGGRRPHRTRWRLATAFGPMDILGDDQKDILGPLSLQALDHHLAGHAKELCDASCRSFHDHGLDALHRRWSADGERRGGGPDPGPPRDGPDEDRPDRDGPVEDRLDRDGPVEDRLDRDGPLGDGSPEDGSSSDNLPEAAADGSPAHPDPIPLFREDPPF